MNTGNNNTYPINDNKNFGIKHINRIEKKDFLQYNQDQDSAIKSLLHKIIKGIKDPQLDTPGAYNNLFRYTLKNLKYIHNNRSITIENKHLIKLSIVYIFLNVSMKHIKQMKDCNKEMNDLLLKLQSINIQENINVLTTITVSELKQLIQLLDCEWLILTTAVHTASYINLLDYNHNENVQVDMNKKYEICSEFIGQVLFLTINHLLKKHLSQ